MTMPRTMTVLVTASALSLVAGCGDRSPAPAVQATAAPKAPPAPSQEPSIPPVPDDAPRSSVASNPPGSPPVEFQPPELHFGVIEPGGTGRGSTRICPVTSMQNP